MVSSWLRNAFIYTAYRRVDDFVEMVIVIAVMLKWQEFWRPT